MILRLGRYVGLRGPGLYWIIPLRIERATTIDIRTLTVSAEQQETITRDSVTIKVNAVLGTASSMRRSPSSMSPTRMPPSTSWR